MTQPPSRSEPVRTLRRRPRDRRERILAQAAELFGEHGYHAVSIEQIGAAVDMTGSAVYRHFPTKEALFAATVERAVERVLAAISAAAGTADEPAAVLERIAEAAVTAGAAQRDLILGYLREAVYLPEEERLRIQKRQREVTRLCADRLVAARPELTPAQAAFLVRAANGVIVGRLRAGGRPGSRRIRALAVRMYLAVLAAPVPDGMVQEGRAEVREPAAGAFTARPSRREELLAAAAGLFRRSGFREVGVDDIGAAVGISGPAVYRHFRNKQAILVAAFRRTSESIAAGANQALAEAADAAEALDRLIDSYAATALANQDLIVVYEREARSLPEGDRREFGAIQGEYIKQWTHVLGALSPGLAAADARTVAYAVLGLVNELIAGSPPASAESLRPWLAEAAHRVIKSVVE
ncbi:DNA-binding transcriptional regulator, AcrR family [Thermomonospora echinospora]|uniref:DNA-binding transcriptional regulator, AcrR family n=1 Tax=Thermomonospora echinospora TaxID=1992 RepID=A0A1H6E391_9ACTN|nr:TetR family transcriptional regulator [Thermomonospora echinospora]SEG91476.1 DNA-binding transcriptional regulator, AcrR family [Thermomonospora echinospora]